MLMRGDNRLYYRVLNYAYKKSEKPFTLKKLFEDLNISDDGDSKASVHRLFLNAPSGSSPLITCVKRPHDAESLYQITQVGMSAAMQMFELESANKNSKFALKMSVGAVLISTAVALFGIWLDSDNDKRWQENQEVLLEQIEINTRIQEKV